ncbi:MAG: hypothetical protein SWK90_05060 [Chloroflexota bacterium]|nr:hypothetical protein [Chloroflexota bacterium]
MSRSVLTIRPPHLNVLKMDGSLRPPGNLLHLALVSSDLLGRISPLVLIPVWLVLAAIACWPWETLRIPAAALALAFTIADGTGLALLPRRGRSFGPVTPPLLVLSLGHTALVFSIGLLWATSPGLLLTATLNLAITAVFLYATWIEPFRIRVTQCKLRSHKLDGYAPLSLLHITDLHIENITPREHKLLRLVEELAPDVIVLTGDYLNLSSLHDSQAQAEAYDLLAQLCGIAHGPVYATTGSPPVDHPNIVPAIFDGLPIIWLLDEVAELDINGHTLSIIGLRCTHEHHQDAPSLHRLTEGCPQNQFTLLLYHSPDLMPDAVELGIDLYLCGHTHGGQMRLPLFGAIFTSSDFWKRYEMGHYEEENTTLYVNRGLGMEGMGAPRARFLAPPEVVLWTLFS